MAYTATMTRQSKPRSGVALGGIGAGWFELRQDGVFYNWSIFNNRPLGLGAPFTMANDSILFFVVRYQEAGHEPKMRLLQIEDDYGAAAIIDHPHTYVFPWISGVDRAEYTASFPFCHMRFTDEGMPFVVELEAFSPFIPHDVKSSALPAAIFRFKVTSQTEHPVDVMLMASMRNAVGYDMPRSEKRYLSRLREGRGYRAFELACDGVDEAHSSYGTMGIASLSPTSTYYVGWEHRHPYYEIALRNHELPNVDDTAARHTKNRDTGQPEALERCFGTIARSETLAGRGSTLEHTFVATWHFPNLYAQAADVPWWRDPQPAERLEGHFYDRFFDDASQVGQYVCDNLDDLTARTRGFHEAFHDSSAPPYVLDQINSQLNTFFTSSWLTREGNFGILEGLDAFKAYAGLTTIDVAMYGGVATAALFPDLERNTMRVHKAFQSDGGVIAHSIDRNYDPAAFGPPDPKRLDMPAQYAFQALRAFFWSSDRPYLEEVWPSVKRTLEYVLRERDKNGDCLPDMEGVMCSYDNFPMYGVSSYVGSQWLAALALAIRAAEILGDDAAAKHYRSVSARSLQVFEEQLWNGQYYRLYTAQDGRQDEGCMADQILGQWAGRLVGIELLDRQRVKRALKHVMRANHHPEVGLRNCTWPGDAFLHDVEEDIWVDQANTAWTGVELAFASLLLYEGLYEEALRVVKSVDDRYRKSGLYWDHKEFGGHYFRPMSAWAIVNGLLGLSIADGHYTFAPCCPGNPVRLFFAFASGTATYARTVDAGTETVTVTVHTGTFQPKALTLSLAGEEVRQVAVTVAGLKLAAGQFDWQTDGATVHLAFRDKVRVGAGQRLVIEPLS